MKYLIFAIFISTAYCDNDFECDPGSWKIQWVCLTKDYEADTAPNKTNDIKMSFSLNKVTNINECDGEITLKGHLIIEWIDPRLTVSPRLKDTEKKYYNNMMEIDRDILVNMWYPSIHILNASKFKQVKLLDDLAALLVNSQKKIVYQRLVEITIECHLYFVDFPWDSHNCQFIVTSESENTRMIGDTMFYDISRAKPNPNYEIKMEQLKSRDLVYHTLGGSFSTAGFNLKLERKLNSTILTYFIFSGFLAVCSWLSLAVPMVHVTCRLSCIMMSLLILVYIFICSTTAVSINEYFTFMDIWILVCIINVLITLFEYGILLLIYSKYLYNPHDWNDITRQGLINKGWKVDRIFLILLPILFTIFTCIFFFMKY